MLCEVSMSLRGLSVSKKRLLPSSHRTTPGHTVGSVHVLERILGIEETAAYQHPDPPLDSFTFLGLDRVDRVLNEMS